MSQPYHLLILGCGYVGSHLARACLAEGMTVTGSTRSQAHATELRRAGIHAIVAASPLDIPDTQWAKTTHLIDSIPLTKQGDTMSASQTEWLPSITPKLTALAWAGYLSTTGVYGDAGGAWVDETYPCRPSSVRGKQRLRAEQAWLNSGLPIELFRLAGIYGPERNLIERLQAGGYQAIKWQPDHYASRIHVDDIVATLLAAMHSPKAGRILNVADDLPLPHSDYVQQLAAQLGAPAPIILTPEEGEQQLSPTVRSFFSDNKRISNQRLHDELRKTLTYPTFKQGIAALLA